MDKKIKMIQKDKLKEIEEWIKKRVLQIEEIREDIRKKSMASEVEFKVDEAQILNKVLSKIKKIKE